MPSDDPIDAQTLPPQAHSPATPRRGRSHPVDREGLRANVDTVLAQWARQVRSTLVAVDEDLDAGVDAIDDLLRGGKRLRAAFCYWGWRGAGRSGNDDIITVAAGLELVQAAALLHDDIIDASDLRRGLPAAHRRLEAQHRARGWRGDPARFGEATAILAGDLCLSASAHLMHRGTAAMPTDRREAGLAVYDEMIVVLTAGQYLDVLVGARPNGPDAARLATRVIQLKTISYTVDRPLAVGAALAGASQQTRDAYHEYAEALGEAFQLRDDVLGVYGDPDVTGKPSGDDLREGKQTLLVALARERCRGADAALLDRIGRPDLADTEIDDLRTLLADHALDRVEARISSLAESARVAADTDVIDQPARQVLLDLVEVATRRQG